MELTVVYYFLDYLSGFENGALMLELSLVNGQPSAMVPINDRGLAYGDGVFETIAVNQGVAEFYYFHIKRLLKGCERLAITLDRNQLEAEVAQLLAMWAKADNNSAVLKVTVTRQAGSRGYRAEPYANGQRYVQISHANRNPQLSEQGVCLRICHTPLAINPVLAGIKHLCRLENVLARAEWDDSQIYEGLLLDTEGFVVEGVMSNVFMVRNAQLITPAVDRCGVAGIIRDIVLNSYASQLSLDTSVDRLLPVALQQADEVFICNSVIGIVPVVAIDNTHFSIGPVTRALQLCLLEQSHV